MLIYCQTVSETITQPSCRRPGQTKHIDCLRKIESGRVKFTRGECNTITAINVAFCCQLPRVIRRILEPVSNLSHSLVLPAESLEPTYQQLQKMKLDKSPFVVVSVIGQELLTASHHTASVVVLEAALKIGTCSLKLRGSVFSALSSAHWSLGNTEKSTGYMQQDLEVAKTLGKRP